MILLARPRKRLQGPEKLGSKGGTAEFRRIDSAISLSPSQPSMTSHHSRGFQNNSFEVRDDITIEGCC